MGFAAWCSCFSVRFLCTTVFALLRIAEYERCKVIAICMAEWVGHSLMSVLISSSVQGSRHSSSVMLRPCCAGPFWRAYGGGSTRSHLEAAALRNGLVPHDANAVRHEVTPDNGATAARPACRRW